MQKATSTYHATNLVHTSHTNYPEVKKRAAKAKKTKEAWIAAQFDRSESAIKQHWEKICHRSSFYAAAPDKLFGAVYSDLESCSDPDIGVCLKSRIPGHASTYHI